MKRIICNPMAYEIVVKKKNTKYRIKGCVNTIGCNFSWFVTVSFYSIISQILHKYSTISSNF